MDSNPRDYLHRRYRRATIVMLAGWLAGLAQYGGSYLHAQRAAKAAPARAQAIWNNPEPYGQGMLIDASSLPKIDRIALLDLIILKRESPTQAPHDPRANLANAREALVDQFVRVNSAVAKATGAHIESLGDGWHWSITPGSTWSDSPSDDWWFADPATSYTNEDLSGVRDDMERHGRLRGFAIALIFSMPWLWYFMLARFGEIGDAFRGSH